MTSRRRALELGSNPTLALRRDLMIAEKRLETAENGIIILRRRVRDLESENSRLRMDAMEVPRRDPEQDLSLFFKAGDKVRPNGASGSVTLLRNAGTRRGFRPIVTWSQHEVPPLVRQLLADDSPSVVVRLRGPTT